MNAVVKQMPEVDVVISQKGMLYRFFSICFAYPDESTHAWWKDIRTIHEILGIVSSLDGTEELVRRITPKFEDLVTNFSLLTSEEFESTYIAMFACGVPQVLCPPYSSLYSSADDDKRLAEMHKVTAFYEEYGMVISSEFKDLPDHASVEFEFLQYLEYEKELARATGHDERVGFFQNAVLTFLDRHVLKMIDGMVAVSATIEPNNVCCQIIDIVKDIVHFDHESRGAAIRNNPSSLKG
jgi:nitrate reductase assembly molybdenum cofactor insertion protein NarJ